MKGIGSESKRRVVHVVADKTECERETKQTARQEQGGAWEHAPGIKGGRARMSRQRETVLIVVYDVVHVQRPGLNKPAFLGRMLVFFGEPLPARSIQNQTPRGGLEKKMR